MAKLCSVFLLKSLGLEGGGVNVFMPKGRSCYHVFFRHRGRQISRSCGTSIYSVALQRALEILAEVIRPAVVRTLPETNQTTSVPVLREDQIAIEEIIAHYDDWLKSAKPGQKRPRTETAKGYRRRLLQLAKLLEADTVRSLADKLCGLTREKFGMSEANFVTMIRNAAAIFATAPREYYATRNMQLSDPFGGSLPAAPERPHFESPAIKEIEALKQKAASELRVAHSREWRLFLLTLGAGLRVQEATHLRWRDVTPGGIAVKSSTDHETKSGKSRSIPCSPNLPGQLEFFRGLPGDFVIPDGEGRHPADNRVAKVRCSRVARRLSGWLRNNGISNRNPNHALRKVFGSIVAQEHGLVVASRYLGHSSLAVTEDNYVGLIGGGPRAAVV